MKNKIFLMCVFIFVLACAATAFAAIPDANKIKVTLISQEPDPANPGDVIDLRFKIENLGSEETGDLLFEILPEYPFSLYRGAAQTSIGSLQGYQTNEKSVIVLYKIKVDENAAEGTETMDIRYKEDKIGTSWTEIVDFPIRIRTRDIVISVVSIVSSVDPIPPGKQTSVTFTLKNNADSLVRDLKIKLDMSDSTVPFAPTGSTTEKETYHLDSRQLTDFIFTLIAEPDAEGGVYKIPIEISYSDETGASYSKKDVVSLKIAAIPDVLAFIDSTEIYSKKKSGEASIKLVNRGLTELKLLTAKLESNDDFEVLSQQEVYVGNIDSDDYETVDFMLDVKSRKDRVILPLELIYKDSTNEEFKETKNITLRMLSASDAQKAGLVQKSSSGLIIFILIAIAGAGIWWWRKRKKKSQKK
jgi:hypothetical protein